MTCNKLSHCLFDFDCADFNVYEQEQYNYQEFFFKKLQYHQYVQRDIQPEDIMMTREGIMVYCTPFSQMRKLKANHSIVLRFIYKAQDGKLWAYNKPKLNYTYFSEIPSTDGNSIIHNDFKETKEKREADEDEENDVDLNRTMWLIIRKKRSPNQILKDFWPDY